MSPDNPSTPTTEVSLSQVNPRTRADEISVGTVNPRARVIETSSSQIKPEQVIDHEIKEAELSSKHKRDRENATFQIMRFIGAILLLVLLAIIFLPLFPALANAFTAEQRAGAITALISLFTGVVGYFTGSQIK